jgi:nicotinamidase-related amidase
MNSDTALLVIDVQVHMFSASNPVYQGDKLLVTIQHLLAKARQAFIPIIYIQQHREREGHPLEYGTAGWQIHPSVAPLKEDTIIQKQMPDAFYKTDLHDHLRTRNINKLILCGIQTELCIDTTCRQACSLDYDVTLVKDGHSTWDRQPLTAPQMIAYHNTVLGDWFVTTKEEQDILFETL